jgi:hypothetical protein
MNAQRALVELLLFLIPFAVFLIYRAASRDLRIRDPWPWTRLVIIGAVIAILGLILPPLLAPRETGKCYDPIRREANGTVVPPKEIPCVNASMPGGQTEPVTPTTPPVAPRDRSN